LSDFAASFAPETLTKQTVGTPSLQPVPHTHTHSLVSGCWNGLYMTRLMDRGTFCQVTDRSSSDWLVEASPGARALWLAAFEVAERRNLSGSRLLFWPGQDYCSLSVLTLITRTERERETSN